MLLYYLDLAGVTVFAASGVLATRDRNLDIFGTVVVATLTAVGGGTLRDLLLGRQPIFWIVDHWYLVTILLSTLATALYLWRRPPPGFLFLAADAFGLAIFAIAGAKLALLAGHSALIVIVMGTMTGVVGGMLRDVITAHVPLILQREVYATAAIAGIVVYMLLHALSVPENLSFSAGAAVVFGLRLVAIRWGLNLPTLPMRSS